MASIEDVSTAVSDAVVKLAGLASRPDYSAAVAADFARAAKDLAEAYAWLVTPGQPH